MKVALVGNQNSGKTLLFNGLTGLNQKVGNWAGVTVERKEGIIKKTDITVVDLPGIYSLSPYTPEEEISRKFIIEENPDLIVNIIDSTSIERSLYLTTQLLELGIDVIVALNMEDILKKRGLKIDTEKLSNLLGTTVLSISALKKTGIKELIEKIKTHNVVKNTNKRIFSPDIETLISEIEFKIAADLKEKRFAAIKIIERDERYSHLINSEIEAEIVKVEAKYNQDSEELIADKRYQYIESIRDKTVTKSNKKSFTEKIDKVLLNKWAAIPIFIIIMGAIYMLSVGVVGGLTVNLVDAFFNGASEGISIGMFEWEFANIPSNFPGVGPWLAGLIEGAGGSAWASSMVADGLIAGFGAVMNFVPQLIILFICLSLLETVGYMSRITFLFDRFFKKIGMSGKSLIPFIVGTGCSVPGIMAARTVEDSQEHKMTVTLTPFMPCSAKLPIITLFAGQLFPKFAWLTTFGMYVLAIVVIILSGWLLNKFFIKSKSTSYINELPEYHLPSGRYIVRDVADKTWSFLKRAGTIIVLCSVVVWFLSSFTWSMQFVDGETVLIKDSMLAGVGSAFSWLFYPMLGFTNSWAATVSAFQGLVAKEAVVSSMEVIAAVEGTEQLFASGSVFNFFSQMPIVAVAFMIFNLFSAPCFGAIGAMRRELGSTKAMFKAIGFQTGFAWVLASLIGVIGGIVNLCTTVS